MGRGIVSVKRTDLPQRSYSQKVETWLQVHGGEWDKRDDITEQRGYLRSGGVAVSRKNQHPQLECKRNLQLSGIHDAWGTVQTDLMPCLGQQDSFFIPSDGETAKQILLHWAVSDSRYRQGRACGKSLQSLQEAAVGEVGAG